MHRGRTETERDVIEQRSGRNQDKSWRKREGERERERESCE